MLGLQRLMLWRWFLRRVMPRPSLRWVYAWNTAIRISGWPPSMRWCIFLRLATTWLSFPFGMGDKRDLHVYVYINIEYTKYTTYITYIKIWFMNTWYIIRYKVDIFEIFENDRHFSICCFFVFSLILYLLKCICVFLVCFVL